MHIFNIIKKNDFGIYNLSVMFSNTWIYSTTYIDIVFCGDI